MKWIASAMVSALLPFTANAAEYPAAVQIAAAESAFAAHSVATDMREAFLAAFAEDSTLLRSGPVPGREAIRKNPAPPIELNWRPAFVYAAASGEIGYSTGPWRITSKNDPLAPPRFGQFVSVWKRQADGVWKVFIDLGISHPGPALADAWLILSRATQAGADEAAAKNAEKMFRKSAKNRDIWKRSNASARKTRASIGTDMRRSWDTRPSGRCRPATRDQGRKSSAQDCQERVT